MDSGLLYSRNSLMGTKFFCNSAAKINQIWFTDILVFSFSEV